MVNLSNKQRQLNNVFPHFETQTSSTSHLRIEGILKSSLSFTPLLKCSNQTDILLKRRGANINRKTLGLAKLLRYYFIL